MSNIQMKTVIALSKSHDCRPAVQFNAVGHLALAVGRACPDMQLADYRLADGQPLGQLSWWPLILLSGRPGKVRDLWRAAQAQNLAYACFTESMIEGGSVAQLEATGAQDEGTVTLVAVAIYGPVGQVDGLTRKLSLWRPPAGLVMPGAET